MANPERGEVALVITRSCNGLDAQKEYTLKLSMNAVVNLQARRKKPMSEIVAEVELLDFASIRDIAFVLLQKYHAAEFDTLEKVGDLMDDAGGIAKFFEAFQLLMELNAGTTRGDGAAHPQTAQALTGVDSMLTPVEAG